MRPGKAVGAMVVEGPGSGLAREVEAWIKLGEAAPLIRRLDRELDGDGVPRRLEVGAWWGLAGELAEAARRRPEGWPASLDERAGGLVRAALRFTRPDGSTIFGPGGSRPDRGEPLRFWASRLADPGLGQVARWWFPQKSDRRRDQAAPPLPAFGSGSLPLAILRADWSATGDLLAIDGRDASGPDRLELIGRGRRLLGPDWSSGLGSSGPAKPARWATGPNADLFEWSFRAGEARVTRTAVLLRGRELALLAEQVDGASGASEWRVGLAPGVEASPIAESQAIAVTSGRVTARALPIALDERSGRGSLAVEGGALVLRQSIEGRRAWLPLLVSWRGERNRKPARWRVLTVTERGRICSPDAAFAARVSWGMDEALVLYRSLGPARPRAFLGHQTSARFLVGAFGRTGRVEPLVTIDE